MQLDAPGQPCRWDQLSTAAADDRFLVDELQHLWTSVWGRVGREVGSVEAVAADDFLQVDELKRLCKRVWACGKGGGEVLKPLLLLTMGFR